MTELKGSVRKIENNFTEVAKEQSEQKTLWQMNKKYSTRINKYSDDLLKNPNTMGINDLWHIDYRVEIKQMEERKKEMRTMENQSMIKRVDRDQVTYAPLTARKSIFGSEPQYLLKVMEAWDSEGGIIRNKRREEMTRLMSQGLEKSMPLLSSRRQGGCIARDLEALDQLDSELSGKILQVYSREGSTLHGQESRLSPGRSANASCLTNRESCHNKGGFRLSTKSKKPNESTCTVLENEKHKVSDILSQCRELSQLNSGPRFKGTLQRIGQVAQEWEGSYDKEVSVSWLKRKHKRQWIEREFLASLKHTLEHKAYLRSKGFAF